MPTINPPKYDKDAILTNLKAILNSLRGNQFTYDRDRLDVVTHILASLGDRDSAEDHPVYNKIISTPNNIIKERLLKLFMKQKDKYGCLFNFPGLVMTLLKNMKEQLQTCDSLVGLLDIKGMIENEHLRGPIKDVYFNKGFSYTVPGVTKLGALTLTYTPGTRFVKQDYERPQPKTDKDPDCLSEDNIAVCLIDDINKQVLPSLNIISDIRSKLDVFNSVLEYNVNKLIEYMGQDEIDEDFVAPYNTILTMVEDVHTKMFTKANTTIQNVVTIINNYYKVLIDKDIQDMIDALDG